MKNNDIKELELELELYKDNHKHLNNLLEQKDDIINKAIEYIEDNCQEYYVNEPHYRGVQFINIEDLLNILKGEE